MKARTKASKPFTSKVPDHYPADVDLTAAFWTPMTMGITALIVGAVVVTLWVLGAVADSQTHMRVTGQDVGTIESMFNDLETPSAPVAPIKGD